MYKGSIHIYSFILAKQFLCSPFRYQSPNTAAFTDTYGTANQQPWQFPIGSCHRPRDMKLTSVQCFLWAHLSSKHAKNISPHIETETCMYHTTPSAVIFVNH
jgi:hypothetical protein